MSFDDTLEEPSASWKVLHHSYEPPMIASWAVLCSGHEGCSKRNDELRSAPCFRWSAIALCGGECGGHAFPDAS